MIKLNDHHRVASLKLPANRDNIPREISQLRSTKLAMSIPGTCTAEFLIILEPSQKLGVAKVEDAKFISGSDCMKDAAPKLRETPFSVDLPSGSEAHLLRRGILGCYPTTSCAFTFYRPNDVHSVQ